LLFGTYIELGVSHGYDDVACGLKNLEQIAAQLPVGANQKHLHRVTRASALPQLESFICFNSLEWSIFRIAKAVGLGLVDVCS
jgi:hypothetical protein